MNNGPIAGQIAGGTPEKLGSRMDKAHHEVCDDRKEYCLDQVVWQLHYALRNCKRQFVVHASCALAVHHAAFQRSWRLYSA